MSRRRRIEAAFTRWGHWVVRHRWLVILACTAFSAVLVSKLPEMRVDNSDEAFLHADDPTRVQYMAFQDQFDREDRVAVILRPERVFDFDFLSHLRALHADIESNVPYVEEVTSLVNARNTRGEGDELIVEDLMENWPQTEAELAAIRERALANPLYIDILLSENESHTVISLKPFTYSTQVDSTDLAGFEDAEEVDRTTLYLTDVEGYELVDALKVVLARHETPEIEVNVVGGPTFDYQMAKMLQRDVSVFMGLSVGVVLVLLYVVFRRASGVILPTIVVMSAMLSSMGFMVWLDIPFSVTLNMLPAFLLVVGICDSIHILTIVYQRLAAGASKPDAIADALGHSGLAVVMTSITTAAGLASFSIASLLPVAQLGILAPAGVLLAMVYSLALLPALLAAFPLRSSDKIRGASLRQMLGRFLAKAGDLSTNHPGRVVAGCVAVLLLALPGVLQVRFSHDGMRWFPNHDPLKMGLRVMDREFKGASGLEVLVRTGKENGLHDPATLRNIERAMDESLELTLGGRPIPKATSIVDVVKETHQALNENRPDFYTLPDERRLVAQELLLFENSGTDDLEEVTNSQLETARVSIRTPWVDAMDFPPFLDAVEQVFREALGPDVELELTGGAVVFTSVFVNLITTLARSYAFALLVITPLMVLLIGNLRRGLVAMIPNLVPVYLVLALMGWTGIPLDASDAPDRGHRDRPGGGRHHPLHAQVQPLLRRDGRRTVRRPRDPGHHGLGTALHVAGAGRRILGDAGSLHDERVLVRAAGGLRRHRRLPGRHRDGAGVDDAGDPQQRAARARPRTRHPGGVGGGLSPSR